MKEIAVSPIPQCLTSGLVTLEKVQVLLYGAHVKHEPA